MSGRRPLPQRHGGDTTRVPPNPRANTFFALVPPPDVRDRVAALQQRVAARLSPAVHRAPPGNFHLTLAFFGAQPRSRVAVLIALTEGLAMPRGRLVLDRLGVFPRARVGWLGPGEVGGPLATFRQALARRAAAAGLPVDRRAWAPHLTLYRKLRNPLPKLAFEPIGWDCDSFELLRTETGPEGPEYRSLGRWNAVDQDDVPGAP